MKRRRCLLLAVVILLVLVGTPGWLMYREMQQGRLNRALIEAINREDTKAVLSALEQGANANAQYTPPDERSAWERLLERVHFSTPQAPETTPVLIMACQLASNLEVIKALVKHGAKVNGQTQRSKVSPLMIAVLRADDDLVQFLLQQGADVQARESSGQTPLILAGLEDDGRKASLLLDYGADINAQDNRGNTVLHRAAFFGNPDMVKLLLARGANPNIKTKLGETPLMAAQALGNAAMVKLLQQAGAKE